MVFATWNILSVPTVYLPKQERLQVRAIGTSCAILTACPAFLPFPSQIMLSLFESLCPRQPMHFIETCPTPISVVTTDLLFICLVINPERDMGLKWPNESGPQMCLDHWDNSVPLITNMNREAQDSWIYMGERRVVNTREETEKPRLLWKPLICTCWADGFSVWKSVLKRCERHAWTATRFSSYLNS